MLKFFFLFIAVLSPLFLSKRSNRILLSSLPQTQSYLNYIKTIVNLTLKNCDSHYKDEFDYLEYDIRDLPGEKMQEFFGEIADTLEG